MRLRLTFSSAQHNASTPLLKLPLEVKNLIYEYTLGGHLIHITQNYDGGGVKFKSTVCCALISEEKVRDTSVSEPLFLVWVRVVSQAMFYTRGSDFYFA